MARISGGHLAAAVTDAGGLGFLGAGYGDPGWLDEQMALVPSGCRVGIGLITWHMADGALADALSFSPAAIWLLLNARPNDRSMPMTSPVERISGPRTVSTLGNRWNGSTASFTAT